MWWFCKKYIKRRGKTTYTYMFKRLTWKIRNWGKKIVRKDIVEFIFMSIMGVLVWKDDTKLECCDKIEMISKYNRAEMRRYVCIYVEI